MKITQILSLFLLGNLSVSMAQFLPNVPNDFSVSNQTPPLSAGGVIVRVYPTCSPSTGPGTKEIDVYPGQTLTLGMGYYLQGCSIQSYFDVYGIAPNLSMSNCTYKAVRTDQRYTLRIFGNTLPKCYLDPTPT